MDKNLKSKLVKQKLERDFWEANPGQNFESSCVTKVEKKPLPVIFFEASQSEAEQKNSGNDVFSLLSSVHFHSVNSITHKSRN